MKNFKHQDHPERSVQYGEEGIVKRPSTNNAKKDMDRRIVVTFGETKIWSVLANVEVSRSKPVCIIL